MVTVLQAVIDALNEDDWFNVGKLDRCYSYEGMCSVCS